MKIIMEKIIYYFIVAPTTGRFLKEIENGAEEVEDLTLLAKIEYCVFKVFEKICGCNGPEELVKHVFNKW